MKKFLFIALTLILLSPLISAQCLDLTIARSSYFAGETFQAEITGNISKPLTEDSVSFFHDGKEYFPVFNLVQASANKWLVYLNLPKLYGDSLFSVSALCRDPILTQEKKNISFSINPTYDDLYTSAVSQVDGRWASLDVEQNSLALIDLSYNPRLSIDGIASLLSKSDQNQCFPQNCDVRQTSLALISLNKLNSSTDQISNWLHDSENNVNIGLWEMIVDSQGDQNCNILLNNDSQPVTLTNGTNSVSLALPDDPSIYVGLNCSANSAKVSHTYLGDINDYPMLFINGMYSVTINNNKCWGQSYRSQCNSTSTAYAILAIKSLGESPSNEISWLGKNAQTNEEKAILLSLGDSTQKNYLINNQAKEGFWSMSSLSISTTPSIDATVSVLKTLPEESSKKNGEAWLFNYLQSSTSLRDLLLSLQVFSTDKLEPLLSFKQGFFKVSAESVQTITLSNKGIFPINATITVDSSSSQVSLNSLERKDFVFSIPSTNSVEFTTIKIDYFSQTSGIQKTYLIPMIIYPKSYSSQQINSTISPISTSFISSGISILESSITKTLPISAHEEVTFTVMNSGFSEQNVSATFSGLYGIIDSIAPSEFSVSPNGSKIITINFNTQKAFGEYNGSIILQTQSNSISIPVQISVSQEISNQTSEIIPPTNPSSGGSAIKIIGWVMVAVAVVTVGIFFYLRLRKKKQKPAILQQLEKIKKEQE